MVNTANKMVSVTASKILNVPLIVTEQNPRALGATVPELDISHACAIYPKTKFSMLIPEVAADMKKLNIKHVVLFGIESHVCVLQTALDLIENDKHVIVLADGVSSMNQGEVKIAIERLRHAGATISSSESILFQLLEDANHEKFKQLQGLIKDYKEKTTNSLNKLVLGNL
ncbi:Isochorismatase domain-containing protein 1 [Chytridiales sp. JEL 0842]|nr:Isochorismatase domain-containing protein 1 [Chytridiales sp. JEL 0842]